jgi:hypothetical protein
MKYNFVKAIILINVVLLVTLDQYIYFITFKKNPFRISVIIKLEERI